VSLVGKQPLFVDEGTMILEGVGIDWPNGAV